MFLGGNFLDFDLDKRILNNLIGKTGIIARDKYINNAVLIPLVNLNDEEELLFQIRNANIRQGGEVCFPGGRYDPQLDSTYEDTAIRETVEELGIKKEQIKIIGKLGTLIGAAGVCVDTYIGRIHLEPLDLLKYNKEEVEEIFLLPLSYFINNPPEEYHIEIEINPFHTNNENKKEELLPSEKLGFPKRYHQPWKGNKQRILVYKTPFGVIWGITADLIYEFIKVI